jgi:hypothetical protein
MADIVVDGFSFADKASVALTKKRGQAKAKNRV